MRRRPRAAMVAPVATPTRTSAGSARCAQCGAALPAVDLAAPRLVLHCARCRSPERPGPEALAAPSPRRRLLGLRWSRAWALRLAIFALLLGVFIMRMIER